MWSFYIVTERSRLNIYRSDYTCTSGPHLFVKSTVLQIKLPFNAFLHAIINSVFVSEYCLLVSKANTNKQQCSITIIKFSQYFLTAQYIGQIQLSKSSGTMHHCYSLFSFPSLTPNLQTGMKTKSLTGRHGEYLFFP